MARRSHEQIVKEYAKAYDRIRKQIERMAKRGYDVRGLKPERVAKKDIKAKDLEKLKRITNEKIYEKAKFAGESGTKRRKEERSERSRKSAKTKREQPKKPPAGVGPITPPGGTRPTPPTPPTAPEPPTQPGGGEEPVDLGEPDRTKDMSDEEAAAEERFYEDISRMRTKIRRKMDDWFKKLVIHFGRERVDQMLVNFYGSGGQILAEEIQSDEVLMRQLQWDMEGFLPPAKDSDTQVPPDNPFNEEFQEIIQELDDDLPFY